MKRFIAQFHKGGFPELYHVAERVDGQWVRIGEPKIYHEANDEAEARNAGTWESALCGEWMIALTATKPIAPWFSGRLNPAPLKTV